MDSAVRTDGNKWIYGHFSPISEQGSALIDGLNDDLKLARSTFSLKSRVFFDLSLKLENFFGVIFLSFRYRTRQKFSFRSLND